MNNNSTQYVFHSVWFTSQCNITSRRLGNTLEKWATLMRKLAESQQCFHEITSWNGREVLPVPGAELSLGHANEWSPFIFPDLPWIKVQDRDPVTATATKTTPPWRRQKKTYVMGMTLPRNSQRLSDLNDVICRFEFKNAFSFYSPPPKEQTEMLRDQGSE